MKRITALLLCLLMIVSITGCTEESTYEKDYSSPTTSSDHFVFTDNRFMYTVK